MRHKSQASRVAFLGLMLALALSLSFLEGLIPSFPMLPPGVKLGLSNIVTMYCLTFVGAPYAFTLAVLKSFFVLLVRGPTGGFLSLSGGLLSVLAMLVVLSINRKAPPVLQSVVGAIFHNTGQLLAACLVLSSAYVFYYLPVMLISGALMGCLTGLTLRVTTPYLGSIHRAFKQ